MKELSGTVEWMCSPDYKQRFRAEYWQVKIRYEKLKAMCEKWDNGRLDFKPTCPREVYDVQLPAMRSYLGALVIRAQLEGVEL